MHDHLLVEESSLDKHRRGKCESSACSYAEHFSAQTVSTNLALRTPLKPITHTETHGLCDASGYASSTGKILLIPSTTEFGPILSKLTPQPSSRRPSGPGIIGSFIDFATFTLCGDGKEYVHYISTWLERCNTTWAYYFPHSEMEKRGIEDIVLQAYSYAMKLQREILLFNDGGWSKDHVQLRSAQETDWKDAFLDTTMKRRSRSDVENFFSSRNIQTPRRPTETASSSMDPWKQEKNLH
ncbi:unnamed protein product [Tuber aestivum]|uniref:Uncharacterized protein n=1 Tax=Tuber aestivum TaxID=59557 RepID=A0A292PZR3_9PEZI|nr:unnamed protein product [Tuber aestivum]